MFALNWREASGNTCFLILFLNLLKRSTGPQEEGERGIYKVRETAHISAHRITEGLYQFSSEAQASSSNVFFFLLVDLVVILVESSKERSVLSSRLTPAVNPVDSLGPPLFRPLGAFLLMDDSLKLLF